MALQERRQAHESYQEDDQTEAKSEELEEDDEQKHFLIDQGVADFLVFPGIWYGFVGVW